MKPSKLASSTTSETKCLGLPSILSTVTCAHLQYQGLLGEKGVTFSGESGILEKRAVHSSPM